MLIFPTYNQVMFLILMLLVLELQKSTNYKIFYRFLYYLR